MKPSDFMSDPMGSIARKSEAETIARNIMVILKRTGDTFRLLTWDEYKSERLKDSSFTESERFYFDQVIEHCVSGEAAQGFSPAWANQVAT